MKTFNTRIGLYFSLAAAAFTTSCAPTFDGFESNSTGTSSANFSSYIAIGNSLTAGFADGGLYLEGQKVAYPNLIADKMKAQGGSEFNSPFFTEAQSNGSGYIRLKALVDGQPQLENVTDRLAYVAAGKLAKYTEPIQNLGIPGMRLDHSGAAGVAVPNMYFGRLLPDNELTSKSYQDFTTSRNHTFFTFWLGSNDALGYATNGAVDAQDGKTTLTSVATFKAVYTQFIGKLTTHGQKGAVANIPDVSAVPHLTTVTRKALLAAASSAANTIIDNLYITTKDGVRVATDKDMFVLTFSSSGLLGKPDVNQRPYGLDPRNAIDDKWVLDEKEVVEVRTRVNEYNAIIKEIATDKGLALVDANSFLNKVKNGYVYNGVGISSAFITGNIFSLDGIHLTPMGYAIVANLFIESINSKYNSSLQKVDVTRYRGVIIP